ncbi:MAG: TIGR00295 family protein [Thermoproteota archaeon]|nr:TIGR00295 family protein [Thermoproteota archaeon]
MSEQLPSRRKALQLLKKSGCSGQVIQHCRVVATLATEIAEKCQKKGFNVDVELVQISALLHDIGRAKTHSVHHAIVGAKIAESAGLPNSIVRIIERHVGGGIDREEAEKLGWPPKSYIPQTLEEKIVAYADKQIEGTRRVAVERTIEKLSKELGENHPSIKRLRKLHKEFLSFIGDFNGDSYLT